MPVFGPISRRELIAALRAAGFDGPYSGGKHQFMVRESLRVRIPNPHKGDISKGLLRRILMQGGISEEEWESL
ncbi:type II toxin-antitoxin system HicA family toxin [Roseofilum sp. BLCC_M154]|jgi:predicted RNA binding protein YcfA (HicA-like mRNA interferase family)|uniref:Type II toxin-antitoxin system HicA family toxin n=1 Tax=Roseofilum acuticapitatum BLCC-M154 TaxID=3022444 RepID=A0ABT7ALS6_9CYAN|nr:type II toxin-antitoxin system HicA family toxin [Roseofilum acuticapitatum]MDJ1167848.1 type II toxin-antitoxin system HicA family toxin [Roseofilum acuticapitatum BLCC-M154]